MRRLGLGRYGGAAFVMALSAGGCTSILGDFNMGADSGVVLFPDASRGDGGPGDGSINDTGGGDHPAPPDGLADSPVGETGCSAPSMVCNNVCLDVSNHPKNCGRCGHDCVGGTCAGGICQPLALAMASPGVDIATDGIHVYWVSKIGGALYQVDVSGQNFMTLAMNASSPVNVVTGGTFVYWTQINPGTGAVDIFQTTPGNPNSNMLLMSFTGAQSQGGMVYDVTDTALQLNYNNFMGYAVESCSIINRMCLVAIGFGGLPTDNMASDGTSTMYFGDKQGGLIEQASLPNAGNVSPVTSGALSPNLLAYDSGALYWAQAGDATIWRYTPTQAPMKIAATVGPVDGLAADSTNVYWGRSQTGTVSYASNQGLGAVTHYVLGTPGTTPMRMVRDSVAIYYLQGSGVYKVALP